MKRTPQWKTVRRWKTSGQALILIVLTFFGLLFFLGLMVDLGQIFLAKGYLRRAADSASLAAAAQFRENRGMADMTAAADEVARMNGVAPTSITVETCASMGYVGVLCPKPGDMPKKLVRVTIVMDYPLTFLSLLNIYTVRLVESSTSEAASMDVVLALDVSESMTFDAPFAGGPIGDDPRDPSVCNANDNCEPFHHVKTAALDFISRILNKPSTEEEDRLAIVTFANGWQQGSQGTEVLMGGNWTNDYFTAADAINNPTTGIKVYDPGWKCPYGLDGPSPDPVPLGPCRYYDDGSSNPADAGKYYNLSCPRMMDLDLVGGGTYHGDPSAISACTTTNIGGALMLAGIQFAVQKRPEALWVVVLLTDGQANASFATKGNLGIGSDTEIYPSWIDPSLYPTVESNLPLGFCPHNSGSDWVSTVDSNPNHPHLRYCQDGDSDSYHALTSPPGQYDADDFARDQGKFISCPASGTGPGCNSIKGQGAIIFTIGLGQEILVMDNDTIGGLKPYGGALLRYLAAVGDDGNPLTDPCALETDYSKSCGNYFFAPTGSALDKVFEAIYSRIFTRLTQ
jgi:Flp pilus assembly protein TadG